MQGLTPSQIGVILRDSHGVAKVQRVTGAKILRVLKSKGLAPEIPEDLYWCVVLNVCRGGIACWPSPHASDALLFEMLAQSFSYTSGLLLF